MPRNPRIRTALLAAPLAALLALVSTGTAPAAVRQPAYSAANPNAVVTAGFDANNGMTYVFWRCPDTFSLCGAHTISARNQHYVRAAIPSMGTLGSVPSVSIDLDRTGKGGAPYIYVFWQGSYPKYDLMEAYYNGSWHRPIDLGMGPLYSRPAAPQGWFDSTDSLGAYLSKDGEGVAWMGKDQRLMYATSSNPTVKKSWKGPYYDGVTIGTPPTVADAGGGAEVAFWGGNNDHLYAASFPFDWPEGNTGSTGKFGPCEFNSMGLLGSDPSAAWFQGTQIPGSSGHSVVSSARRPAVTAAKLTSGKCPVMLTGNVSFGVTGIWQVCWSGVKPPGKNIYCLQWLQPPSAAQTIFGPTREGSFGVLGSAPSVVQFPIDNFYSDDVFAFWQGSNSAQDLFRAVIFPPARHDTNLGFGPLSGG